METRSFNSLVEQYLGSRLPDRLADGVCFPELPSEAQNFILRMLALMQQAAYPPTDFTDVLTRMLSGMIPNMLPCAWGGQIPPLTMPGRHQKFDAYVAGQSWPVTDTPPVFIDIGCGFPPVTTMDTARYFPNWQIIGVDRFFAPYVVHDRTGNYACFDRKGEFQYFQSRQDQGGQELYANADQTRKRFEKIFSDLKPSLTGIDDSRSETVEKNGRKLIKNHIRDFEADNLVFKEADIGAVQLAPARIVRCMNVLIYFSPQRRKETLSLLGDLLEDDGILIAGTNGNNLQARYTVYRKETNDLPTPVEFSFSPDNLRSFGVMPWFTIHENDPEAFLLAELTGKLRGDRQFWPAFTQRFDDLLEQFGVCRRGGDGFLNLIGTELSVSVLIQKMRSLWQQINSEGYLQEAVGVLRQNGYKAWNNPVGDISVQPPAGKLAIV